MKYFLSVSPSEDKNHLIHSPVFKPESNGPTAREWSVDSCEHDLFIFVVAVVDGKKMVNLFYPDNFTAQDYIQDSELPSFEEMREGLQNARLLGYLVVIAPWATQLIRGHQGWHVVHLDGTRINNHFILV